MNKWLLAAGALSGLTLVAHFFGGGAQYYDPLLASDMPIEFVAIFAIVWHMATIMLVANTSALVWAGLTEHPHPVLVWIVAGQYAGFAVLFLFYGQTLLGTIWQIPQWTVFAVMAAVAVTGLARPVSAVRQQS